MSLNRTHPITFVILLFVYVNGCLFINDISMRSVYQYISLIFLSILNLLFLSKLKWKNVLWFTLSLIPVLIATFISSYAFAATSNNKLQLAQNLTTRILSIAIISFIYSTHTPYPALINYLMQRKFLGVRIGYSLLAVFNSFTYLTSEFLRIRAVYKIRYHKKYLSPRIIIPLFISASRYAHRVSISLYSRGLNENKTFHNPIARIDLKNIIIWFINIAIVLIVMRF